MLSDAFGVGPVPIVGSHRCRTAGFTTTSLPSVCTAALLLNRSSRTTAFSVTVDLQTTLTSSLSSLCHKQSVYSDRMIKPRSRVLVAEPHLDGHHRSAKIVPFIARSYMHLLSMFGVWPNSPKMTSERSSRSIQAGSSTKSPETYTA